MKYSCKLPILLSLVLLSGCSQNTTDSPTDSSSVTDSQNSESTEEMKETQETDSFTLEFTAPTISGETLDSSIFSNYDLTVINIWATWCGPCVQEMPYLQDVYEQLPENVNFFSMCQDGDLSQTLAEQILSTSNATFHTVLPSDSLKENLFPMIRAFPTTIFLDSNGTLITAIEGAPPNDVTQAYLDIIQQVLGSL